MFRDFLRNSNDEKLRAYFEDIGKRFCPFLIPAIKADALIFSEYNLAGSKKELQEQLFYYGVIHTEILRVIRRRETVHKHKLLLSENVIANLLDSTSISGEDLFEWPHWVLKCLYSGVGILFGKFWIGEKDVSQKTGLSIPSPIKNILTIRSALMPTDERFFSLSAQLLSECNVEKDIEQNVFSPLTLSAIDREAIVAVLSKLQSTTWDASVINEIKSRFEKIHLYEKSIDWSKQFLIK
jgi:hypothetical protein